MSFAAFYLKKEGIFKKYTDLLNIFLKFYIKDSVDIRYLQIR